MTRFETTYNPDFVLLPDDDHEEDGVYQFDYDAALWAGHPLGVILHAYREAYGVSLYDVSDALRIRAVYLQYLEEGNYDGLPGYAYGLGFLKVYAEYLGLPVEEMATRYRLETGIVDPVEVRPLSASPVTRVEDPFPVRLVLATLIAASAIIYLVYALLTGVNFGLFDGRSLTARLSDFVFGTSMPVASDETGQNGTVPGAPAPLEGDIPTFDATAIVTAPQADTRAPASGAANRSRQIVYSEDRVPVAAGGSPIPGRKPDMNVLVARSNPIGLPGPNSTGRPVDGNTIAPRVVTATTQVQQRQQSVGETGRSRITLVARGETWVQLRDANQNMIQGSVLQQGQQLAVPLQDNLILTAEDLTRLTILVDGIAVTNPASLSTVTDTIVLNADRLAAGVTTGQ